MMIRFRRSKVFESSVQLTDEIKDALKEIGVINAYFKAQHEAIYRVRHVDWLNVVREAGPRAARREELIRKVREFFQTKIGPDFILCGWDNDEDYCEAPNPLGGKQSYSKRPRP
jgi:hypothetical protein